MIKSMALYTEISEVNIPEILEMMEAFYAIDSYSYDRKRSKGLLENLLKHPRLGKLWKIEHDGSTAGYVLLVFSFSLEYGGSIGIIDELYLKPDYRNRGLGGKAMAFVEEQARVLGVKTLLLEVENHNTVGKQLYEKQGFQGKERTLLNKGL